MKETSNSAKRQPHPYDPPTRQDFCRWFWYQDTRLFGVHDGDRETSREAALRLFEHFNKADGFQSEDEAIHSMREDRDGTLSLSDATRCKAGLEGWDLPAIGKDSVTIPSLKWDTTIFVNSTAWMFFREAIEERWPRKPA